MTHIKDHFNFLQKLFYKFARHFISDQHYAQMSLKRWIGFGDVSNPQTFNEKIQWLKLYWKRPEYSDYADKFKVRRLVEEKIGTKYLNICYRSYLDASEIDFESLPSSFVIKTTHGSGMNIFVTDKVNLNKKNVIMQINKWLTTDYSSTGREWIYQAIQPRIIIERLLKDGRGDLPKDFKVFCFSGIPKYIQVDVDRFSNHTRAFYDIDWVRQPFTILFENFQGDIPRPDSLTEMLECARVLAKGIPFVRVDFYLLDRVYFGEMTFYPENGAGFFDPIEWDRKFGDELELPSLQSGNKQ